MIANTHGVEEQAQILGEVVAVGENGRPVLDALASKEGAPSVAGLTVDEIRQLGRLPSNPAERLRAIAGLLREEGLAEPQAAVAPPPATEGRQEPAPRPAPGGNAPSGGSRRGMGRRVPGARNVREDEGQRRPNAGPGGGGPASGAGESQRDALRKYGAVLTDDSAEPSSRFEAAIAMKEQAVPSLAQMLRGADADGREVAFAALMDLGLHHGLDKAVHREVTALKLGETQPGVRLAATCIAQRIEHGTAAPSGQARHLPDQGKIGDGLLRRALASCDEPGILRAAAGREVVAIPLAVRQLASLRSRRAAQGD